MTTNLTYTRLYSWNVIEMINIIRLWQYLATSSYAFSDDGIYPASAAEPQPSLIDLTKEMEEKP